MLRIGAIRPIQFRLGDVVFALGVGFDHLADDDGLLGHADDGAVLQGGVVHLDGDRQATADAACKLHHDIRVAGDVFRHRVREQPGIEVVAAAGAAAHDEGDGLALVKILDAVGAGRRGN